MAMARAQKTTLAASEAVVARASRAASTTRSIAAAHAPTAATSVAADVALVRGVGIRQLHDLRCNSR